MKESLNTNILDALLQHTHSGVWIWDIHSGEEWWSDNYYRLLCYEPGEIQPSYNTFIKQLLHKDDIKYYIKEDGSPILRGIT